MLAENPVEISVDDKAPLDNYLQRIGHKKVNVAITIFQEDFAKSMAKLAKDLEDHVTLIEDCWLQKYQALKEHVDMEAIRHSEVRSSLESEVNTLKNLRDEDHANFQRQLENLRNENTVLLTDRESLNNIVSELQSALKLAQESNQEILTQNGALKQQIEEFQKENAELKLNIEDLSSRDQMWSQKELDYIHQVEELNEKLERSVSEAEELKKQLEEAKKQLNRLAEAVTQKEEAEVNMKNIQKDLQVEITSIQEATENVTKELEDYRAQIEVLTEELNEKNQTIVALKESQNKVVEEFTQAKEEFARDSEVLQAKIASLCQEIVQVRNEAESREQELQLRIRNIQENLSAKEVLVQQEAQEKELLQKQLEAKKSEVEELQAALEMKMVECLEYQKEITTHLETIQALNEAAEKMRQQPLNWKSASRGSVDEIEEDDSFTFDRPATFQLYMSEDEEPNSQELRPANTSTTSAQYVPASSSSTPPKDSGIREPQEIPSATKRRTVQIRKRKRKELERSPFTNEKNYLLRSNKRICLLLGCQAKEERESPYIFTPVKKGTRKNNNPKAKKKLVFS